MEIGCVLLCLVSPLRSRGDDFWHIVIICTTRIKSGTYPWLTTALRWPGHGARTISGGKGGVGERKESKQVMQCSMQSRAPVDSYLEWYLGCGALTEQNWLMAPVRPDEGGVPSLVRVSFCNSAQLSPALVGRVYFTEKSRMRQLHQKGLNQDRMCFLTGP